MTTILGFSGSVREASFNSRILRALPALAPDGVEVVPFDVARIPFYNQDLEGDLPSSIADLRAAVAAADGIVVASPEYNHSYSALAMNEFDGLTFPCAPSTPPNLCRPITGESILSDFSLNEFASLWYNEIVIAAWIVAYTVIGYGLFQWRSKPLMRLK